MAEKIEKLNEKCVLGKPTYISETRDSGEFKIIETIHTNSDGDLFYTSLTNKDNEEIQILRAGLDIIEIPLRGLQLAIAKQDSTFENYYARILECQKFASVCQADYASVELQEGFNGLIRDNYHIFKPRLFRKVVGN